MTFIKIKKYLMIIFLISSAIGNMGCSSGADDTPVPEEPKAKSVVIATYNIGYDNATAPANQLWGNRRPLAVNLITKHKFDIFGAQEPLYNQLQDLTTSLPAYKYLGLSRDGSSNSGEFAPIFYNSETIEILESGQFWLTDQVDKSKPSVGWDARYPRTCVWAKASHKESKAVFYVFNIHLDHVGFQARTESVKLLLSEIPRIANGTPYFLLGDFNFDQNSANYQTLQSDPNFVDTYGITKRGINSQRGTFNGYNPNSTSNVRIDHIFTDKKKSPNILRHQIITDSSSGSTASDHFPVLVEVTF
ncbi:endonuclease/exonuclease/phosphatase family protein [Sphingobacterium spiritivorum]|uniref:endonuclease/exonuclease/phosphatase family protein n=1 Tax=Sphingobacterium spiritivorum TaxID=258 RepID=UPI003DA5226A